MRQDNLLPTFRAPAGACDAHFHIFGYPTVYPYQDPKLRYKPPYAPLSEYMKTANRLGFERFVVVQPSAYGRDNSCLVDAMKELGVSKCRAIVDVDDDVSDTELEKLNALGARGVRINVSPIHPYEDGLADRLLKRIGRMEARCAEIGWQLDFLLPGWLTEHLIERMSKLKVNFTLAHMGMLLAKDGPNQPGLNRLIDLLVNGNGHCWIKLTAVYRMSKVPGYTDAEPIVHRLMDAALNRLIWGSDDPHASFADQVGSVELFNLLGEWAPDEASRKAILLDNPVKLYGF